MFINVSPTNGKPLRSPGKLRRTVVSQITEARTVVRKRQRDTGRSYSCPAPTAPTHKPRQSAEPFWVLDKAVASSRPLMACAGGRRLPRIVMNESEEAHGRISCK